MLRQYHFCFWMLALAFALPLVSNALAEGLLGCHHCGCHRPCEKVCRLVREEKKVTIVCWGCKCEDFCDPGKSYRGCLNCEEVCIEDEAAEGDIPCSASKNFVWYDWTPGCVKGIYTKKKLMTKTIEKKIPSYKWVVEDLCSDCECKCLATQIEPGIIVPLPPEVNAKMVYGVQQASAESENASVAPIAESKPASAAWPSWLMANPFSAK